MQRRNQLPSADISVPVADVAVCRRERLHRQQSTSAEELYTAGSKRSSNIHGKYVGRISDTLGKDVGRISDTHDINVRRISETHDNDVRRKSLLDYVTDDTDREQSAVLSSTVRVQKKIVCPSVSLPMDGEKRNVQFIGVERLKALRKRFQRTPTPFCSTSEHGSWNSDEETD